MAVVSTCGRIDFSLNLQIYPLRRQGPVKSGVHRRSVLKINSLDLPVYLICRGDSPKCADVWQTQAVETLLNESTVQQVVKANVLHLTFILFLPKCAMQKNALSPHSRDSMHNSRTIKTFPMHRHLRESRSWRQRDFSFDLYGEKFQIISYSSAQRQPCCTVPARLPQNKFRLIYKALTSILISTWFFKIYAWLPIF